MQPASDCRMSGLVSFGPGVQCPCASPGSRYVNCSVAIVLADYASANRHAKTIGFCSDSSGRGGSRPARAGKRARSASVIGKWTSAWIFLLTCFCGHPMSRPRQVNAESYDGKFRPACGRQAAEVGIGTPISVDFPVRACPQRSGLLLRVIFRRSKTALKGPLSDWQ